MLSPGKALSIFLPCYYIYFTTDYNPEGAKLTVIPGSKEPASTLPIGTVPTPPILKTS